MFSSCNMKLMDSKHYLRSILANQSGLRNFLLTHSSCATNVKHKIDETMISYNKHSLHSVDIRSAHSLKVVDYFDRQPHLKTIKPNIPAVYFVPRKQSKMQYLYLVDKQIAESAVTHILPFLAKSKSRTICETNVGLGFITKELLEHDIENVRLYEACPNFKQYLNNLCVAYPNRLELFTRDMFHMSYFSYLDRFDQGTRVQQLLNGIPKINWNKDLYITIIGPMPTVNFIWYLIRMLIHQQEIIILGRIQIFALMKPSDYYKLTATSEMSLHVYQVISILFQLFFECSVLDKYSRKSFLPWETKLTRKTTAHLHSALDVDYMYLVHMKMKKLLPVEVQHLLHLFYFIKQGFLRGKPRVIPTLEKWLPNIGGHLIIPNKGHSHKSFQNMSIYTEFRHLNPDQILQLFLEMLDHPEYNSSPFAALVESQLLHNDTVESSINDNLVETYNKNSQKSLIK